MISRLPNRQELVAGVVINEVSITPLGGEKATDISNSILSIAYFENILEPSISVELEVFSSASLFNELPIRGGEKVEFEIVVKDSKKPFTLKGDDALYVYKVSDLRSDKTNETFTLHLITRDYLTNETSRCLKKYNKTSIDSHVKDILQNTLQTPKDISDIETTANAYTFIGNNKKPFHTLQWLGPKGVTGNHGVSPKPKDVKVKGTKIGEAKGTGGFLFYENKDGYHFKSIESLVSPTNSGKSSADSKNIPSYTFGGAIEEHKSPLEIIKFFWDKNIDIRKSLRVGMYSNITWIYDRNTDQVNVYKYDLNKETKGGASLGKKGMDTPAELFGSSPSRVLTRVSDHGTLEVGLANKSEPQESGRDEADMAKSFSRYNLLFTQALNILVPCNTNLKVGDIIECNFPQRRSTDAGKASEFDPETSGLYLIRELRHSFVPNQNTTSLKLMRDSYGLYGPDN